MTIHASYIAASNSFSDHLIHSHTDAAMHLVFKLDKLFLIPAHTAILPLLIMCTRGFDKIGYHFHRPANVFCSSETVVKHKYSFFKDFG